MSKGGRAANRGRGLEDQDERPVPRRADARRPASDYAWWQKGVIYQIYPRSFKDSDGDGTGDLAGVIEKIDYLCDVLGVDAIWLSPFYPSPMADFGYDVADYTDVDPLFGDLETFDRLLEAAHERAMRVIIDFVPNHSSDQHPWFQESRSSRDNPKRDWYVWENAKPDGSPPNNWLSVFGGKAWEWDEKTQQYYLHSFLKEQPDLNWRNPEVKEAMFDVVRFWLDRGVDGLRIDVAHSIMKDPELRDNPLRAASGTHYHKPLGEYDNQVHVHDKGHPDVHDVYRELRSLLDSYGDRFGIGEIHLYEWDSWVRYYGEELDELHMPYNFMLLKSPFEAEAVRGVVEDLETVLPEGAWPNYVLGNHDEPRLATRYGRKQARLAAMLLLTLRGTPTLYYGDELGMQDGKIPPEQMQDPAGNEMPELSRDPCRTPMAWDASPSAGFSDAPPEKLWLPLHGDHEEINVEAELAHPRSILTLYRRLLEIRGAEPALQVGSYHEYEEDLAGCLAYYRELEGRRFLVALNFSEDELSLRSGAHAALGRDGGALRRDDAAPGRDGGALSEVGESRSSAGGGEARSRGDEPANAAARISGSVMVSTELDRSHGRIEDGILLRPLEGVLIELDAK